MAVFAFYHDLFHLIVVQTGCDSLTAAPLKICSSVSHPEHGVIHLVSAEQIQFLPFESAYTAENVIAGFDSHGHGIGSDLLLRGYGILPEGHIEFCNCV